MEEAGNRRKGGVSGFSILESLLIVLVIAALGLGGWYVYHRDHKAKPSNISVSPPAGGKTTTPSPADPYAGWKTDSLTYEILSLKYPPNWSIDSTSTPNGITGTVSPGSDQVVLTSPTGLAVSIKTGVAGIGDGLGSVLSAQSIKTLGSTYYLDFYTNDHANQSNAQGACIATSPTSQANYPNSRNIKTINGGSSTTFNVMCIGYPQDSNGVVPEKSVASFEADASFTDAKLILASLAY